MAMVVCSCGYYAADNEDFKRHRDESCADLHSALSAATARAEAAERLAEVARIAISRFNNAATIHDEMLLSAMSDLQHEWSALKAASGVE